MKKKIVSIIKAKNDINASTLATKIGVSSRTIQRYLKQMKEEGLLMHIGPDNSGHWEIIEKDNVEI